jgi:cyanophycinase
MKNIFFKIIPGVLLLVGSVCLQSIAQISVSSVPKSIPSAKGSLFIIGGGDRDDSLMQRMLKEAGWKKGDEIVIMTLSSIYSDSTYIWSNDQLSRLTGCAAVKFDSASVHDERKLDSLGKARIIFICGGNQSRFMNLIHNSDVKKIIHEAYFNGALIGGTSAGAAVISEKMITGNQLLDTAYESTFDRI